MISFKKSDKKEPEKDQNIFGQSLNAGQIKKTKKEEYIQSKNLKKAYIKLGSSLFVLVLYSVFFFYSNAAAYLKAPGQIRMHNAAIEMLQDEVIPQLEKERDLHKAAYDKEFEEVIAALDTVFPAEIDKLGIVRLFESFAVEVAANFPPFEFTSISLGSPIKGDGYIAIPVSTSIHSSLAGFDRFLTLVDRSGYIYTGEGEDKELVDTKIRLMSISNISIKYRGVDEETGKDAGVDFSVKLNIYARPEAVN